MGKRNKNAGNPVPEHAVNLLPKKGGKLPYDRERAPSPSPHNPPQLWTREGGRLRPNPPLTPFPKRKKKRKKKNLEQEGDLHPNPPSPFSAEVEAELSELNRATPGPVGSPKIRDDWAREKAGRLRQNPTLNPNPLPPSEDPWTEPCAETGDNGDSDWQGGMNGRDLLRMALPQPTFKSKKRKNRHSGYMLEEKESNGERRNSTSIPQPNSRFNILPKPMRDSAAANEVTQPNLPRTPARRSGSDLLEGMTGFSLAGEDDGTDDPAAIYLRRPPFYHHESSITRVRQMHLHSTSVTETSNTPKPLPKPASVSDADTEGQNPSIGSD